MSRPPKNSASNTVAVRPANPEGKGQRGFLRDWQETIPRGVVAKPQSQVLAEFFTSMLVLSAEFNHKPSVGVSNYLYFMQDRWTLSLIHPEQWSVAHQSGFAGLCTLQHDRTWTIRLADDLADKPQVLAAVETAYGAFSAMLDHDGTLEDILPFFAGNLRYYQRLNANALGNSIKATLTLGDQRAIPMREWLPALPHLDHVLSGDDD